MIKKDPTTSIRKHANELKEKTVRTAIESVLSSDLKPFDYAIRGVLENRTNTNSHSNGGLLKTAIEEEWNKMSEEFILKTYKSFRRCVNTIIEKTAAIMSKSTVLSLFSYFVVSFFLIKINLVL